jgi:hypothetical protein
MISSSQQLDVRAIPMCASKNSGTGQSGDEPGKYPEAVISYERAIKLIRDLPRFYHLGEAHMKVSNWS